MLLTTEEWEVVLLSLKVAGVAVAALFPFCLVLAYYLARRRTALAFALENVLQLPLVLPPVVTGILLLSLLGPRGPLGRFLAPLGLDVAFTWQGAALASGIVALPLLVQSMRISFEHVAREWEEAGYVFGGSRWSIFRLVTLPLAARGIVAGAILAFARAIGEFGATIVLAGNIPGETRTLSLAIYSLFNRPGGEAAMYRLVWVAVGVSVVSLVAHVLLTRRLHDPHR